MKIKQREKWLILHKGQQGLILRFLNDNRLLIIILEF